MTELRYTFLSDGSSDQSLLPILTWLLKQHGIKCAIQPEWADLRRLPNPPKKLNERLEKAIELYPSDLLFVHRDAERVPYEERKQEILRAIKRLLKNRRISFPPSVCVIPVRMQEAWLLFDDKAIRYAVGNPEGTHILNLPQLKRLEQLADPKGALHDIIRLASGLDPNRQRKIHISSVVRRIAEFSNDFSPLRNLPAFKGLEDDLCKVISDNLWANLA